MSEARIPETAMPLPITDELIADYVDYCEAKRDIEEEPFPFGHWRAIETEVRAEYEAETAP